MHQYKDLIIWKLGIEIAIQTNEVVRTLTSDYKFNIGDQMLRSSISIPSNIAEGAYRNSNRDFMRFLSIANASSAELETQIFICKRISIGNSDSLEELGLKIDQLQKMMRKFCKTLETKS